ncbi:MAG: hypothetical protein ACYDBQ_11560 [Thermoplasmatota archaeon]
MSLISPSIGSAFISILQIGLAGLTLPTILNKAAQVPRKASVPTAVGLWIMAFVFLAMGPLWLAAIGTAAAASGWTLIGVLRPVPSKKT